MPFIFSLMIKLWQVFQLPIFTDSGGIQEELQLAHSQLVMELLADHMLVGFTLLGGHVGDLQEHGRHQVNTLQQLQADVQMGGHLLVPLHLRLLAGSFRRCSRDPGPEVSGPGCLTGCPGEHCEHQWTVLGGRHRCTAVPWCRFIGSVLDELLLNAVFFVV